MSSILPTLISELDRDLQIQIRARVAAMQRHLIYLATSDNQQYSVIVREGWSPERLEVLCELNSFYQIILGPLASSARGGLRFDETEVPIQYGDSLTFDNDRALRMRSAMADFMRRVRLLGIPPRVLTAARADDLLRALIITLDGGNQAGDVDDFSF